MFVITDGCKYLRQDTTGKYVLDDKKKADHWKQYQAAENVIKSSLDKILRGRCRVEKYDGACKDEDIPDTQRKVLDSVKNLLLDLKDEQKKLFDMLGNKDQEIEDVLHYIEFNNLSASDGYCAYKMIQIRRLQRREIKNDLAVLHSATNHLQKYISEGFPSEIEKLNNRTYAPRQLPALFKGGSQNV